MKNKVRFTLSVRVSGCSNSCVFNHSTSAKMKVIWLIECFQVYWYLLKSATLFLTKIIHQLTFVPCPQVWPEPTFRNSLSIQVPSQSLSHRSRVLLTSASSLRGWELSHWFTFPWICWRVASIEREMRSISFVMGFRSSLIWLSASRTSLHLRKASSIVMCCFYVRCDVIFITWPRKQICRVKIDLIFCGLTIFYKSWQ